MYILVKIKLHLFFTFLPMFAEAVLRMHVHMDSPIITITGRPE